MQGTKYIKTLLMILFNSRGIVSIPIPICIEISSYYVLCYSVLIITCITVPAINLVPRVCIAGVIFILTCSIIITDLTLYFSLVISRVKDACIPIIVWIRVGIRSKSCRIGKHDWVIGRKTIKIFSGSHASQRIYLPEPSYLRI